MRRQLENISRIIFSIIHDYYIETVQVNVKTEVVVSYQYQSFGDLMRWNSHSYSTVLEGGIIVL